MDDGAGEHWVSAGTGRKPQKTKTKNPAKGRGFTVYSAEIQAANCFLRRRAIPAIKPKPANNMA
jgi:hypothetical protein